MKRHAIFVDDGYVFAQGSVSLSGSKTPRTQLKLDVPEFIAQLTTLALAQSAGASTGTTVHGMDRPPTI